MALDVGGGQVCSVCFICVHASVCRSNLICLNQSGGWEANRTQGYVLEAGRTGYVASRLHK